MTDRPVIFSAPMVRALLAGTKTQTRRKLRLQPIPFAIDDRGTLCDVSCLHVQGDRLPRVTLGRVVTLQEVPYAVGDRLWVREAFVRYYELDGDDQPCSELLTCYRADGWPLAGWYDRDREETREAPPWRSPIHMPRALSRLTLTVTEVRVQRLQDIGEDDARAEGATMRPACSGFRQQRDGWSMDWSRVGQPSKFARTGVLANEDISLGSAREAFGAFINELHDPRWNLKGDGIWGENPWVAAISFTVVPANIDSLPEA